MTNVNDQPVLAWLREPRNGFRVAFIHAPREMDRDKPEIQGETITIDGQSYVVRGVDRVVQWGPIRKSEVIGLCLEPIKAAGGDQ